MSPLPSLSGTHHFFITGTDTGIGKTYVTSWLLRAWRHRGYCAAGLKPIACGDREDAQVFAQAMDLSLSLDEINPFFFHLPAAPWVAAQAEGKVVSLQQVNAAIQKYRQKYSHLAVEGVGGWRVPLTEKISVREWAQELGLPVVLVSSPSLGTLNHTLLTIESIQQTGLPIAGIIINNGCPSKIPTHPQVEQSNPKLLKQLTKLPLFELTSQADHALEIPAWLDGKER